MIIPAGQVLKTGYVRTADVVFPMTGAAMSITEVKEKITQFTAIKEAQAYPLPVGRWEGGRFLLWDGRHRYIASLMLGREKMLVAWLEAENNS